MKSETIPLGAARQFTVLDPKERLITAPCFRERVLHHAVINVCEPVFERWLIFDTYACRRGKGRVAAVCRAADFSRRYAFFLKMDIRKYFNSISHEVLRMKLRRLFKDQRLLRLFDAIIACNPAASEVGRGLPIGSLTSQHFANFYLGWLDRFVTEQLRATGYVRYMDDMLIWRDSARELKASLAAITSWVPQELRLTLKPTPYINRTWLGVDFLGCRIFRRHVTLSRRSRRRFKQRIGAIENDFACGKNTEAEMQRRVDAVVAFSRAADARSWRFRSAVLKESW
ncbi:MAG: RNA-directed DNA polymerase [Planctomycetaceae bacterium]|nr:MAG: RNA-directed DNA polymerase [Planctomycetaceae bacterium]